MVLKLIVQQVLLLFRRHLASLLMEEWTTANATTDASNAPSHHTILLMTLKNHLWLDILRILLRLFASKGLELVLK